MTQLPIKEKKLVPISQAARILGVSIDTIRRWDKAGKLHAARLNGKDRYFSLEDLEEIKFAKSLSISEAAMQLKISPATLRRLEKKGLISPKRTQSGERIYDREVIKRFLESDYFAGGRKIKKEVFKPLEKHESSQKEITRQIEMESVQAKNESLENISPTSNLKPWQRVPELLATVIVFIILLAFGARNVMTVAVKIPDLSHPAVLSTEIKDSAPSSPSAKLLAITETPAASPSPKIMLTVKISDGGASVNIRQKPTTNSEKLGLAKDGDVFEFISDNKDWYEVKLASGSGFINARYIKEMEEINE